MRIGFRSFVILACGVNRTLGAMYHMTSQLIGQNFLDEFDFEAISDPTNGRVNYVNESTAIADGLVSVSFDSLVLRADHTTKLSPSDAGRKSFRIKSKSQYDTHVAIFDIAHMPQGCGTWPAIWEVGADWPNQGEIDIVEGVNDQTPNTCSLHTGPNCSMPTSRSMTGISDGTDCAAQDNGNSGCGVTVNDSRSYGPEFNDIGGGWYAIERNPSYIKIFFWERTSCSVPYEVMFPGPIIDPSNWGIPAAYFPNTTTCDFSTHFGSHNIIINLTFCGDWAGNSAVYAASGCPSTCDDYVDNNPSAFDDAYFEFNSLSIYE